MNTPDNFLGLDAVHSNFHDSAVLVLPVPFESTVSYGGGTAAGPQAIITASQQVELYDREFDAEPALHWGVHTLQPVNVDQHTLDQTMDTIAQTVRTYAATNKLLCILGGEHSISGAVAQGLAEVHGSFVTVQIDAHADLRDEYEGTPYSHACAVRRILDVGAGPVLQLGIRSLAIDEAAFIREHDQVTTVWAEDVHAGTHLETVAEFVRGRLVYLTIDIDGLDSSLMPATGTPEPNGLSWHETLQIVRTVVQAASQVIAFDVVELAPIEGFHAADYLTAKLAYKVMNHILAAQSEAR